MTSPASHCIKGGLVSITLQCSFLALFPSLPVFGKEEQVSLSLSLSFSPETFKVRPWYAIGCGANAFPLPVLDLP